MKISGYEPLTDAKTCYFKQKLQKAKLLAYDYYKLLLFHINDKGLSKGVKYWYKLLR